MSKISIKQLAKYAIDQLEAGSDLSDVSQKLASFLLQERRTRDATQLFRAIDRELDERGSTQVVITSAHEISEDVKAQLADMLGAKNPVYDEVIDKSVIGGVKAVAGESQVDLTVRAKLNKFKQAVVKDSI